jgi:anthranilate synthase component 1
MVAIFDAIAQEILLVTPVRPDGASAEAAYAAARARLEAVAADFRKPVPPLRGDGRPEPDRFTTPVSREAYREIVEKAKGYIRAGDIFQVVPSHRFRAPFARDPFAFYRSLRRSNPSPFLFYLNFGDFQLAGSSPEILVRLRDGKITIRPIAGTRPRGATPEEDRRLEEELIADPKERAEHLMLLDLGRNDVGRVSEIGTVTVTDSFFLERYSQVMHIVSNVEGVLDGRRDALDALAAGFPAGTVSGAPKVRAMQIIDELEKDKRGLYAGCIGYFGANGEMDTCIVLRTAVVKDGRMYVQAGAGIVYDSNPDSEQQECINKAKALFRAAEEAVRFSSSARRGQ